ncbi:Uncharacterised protein [Mycolicibacterium flavescens]|nr:Uncharacterised protein [Mycolicibacterium flavescens]
MSPPTSTTAYDPRTPSAKPYAREELDRSSTAAAARDITRATALGFRLDAVDDKVDGGRSSLIEQMRYVGVVIEPLSDNPVIIPPRAVTDVETDQGWGRHGNQTPRVTGLEPSGEHHFSCQHPRFAVTFSLGNHREFSERGGQLPRRDPKAARPGADNTQRRDRQQATGRKPLDYRLVKTRVPESVADNGISGRAYGQAHVEIDDVEPASIADAVTCSKIPRPTDGCRRDVHSPDIHPATRQPHAR